MTARSQRRARPHTRCAGSRARQRCRAAATRGSRAQPWPPGTTSCRRAALPSARASRNFASRSPTSTVDRHRELAEPAPTAAPSRPVPTPRSDRRERVGPVAALVLARERARPPAGRRRTAAAAPALDELLERARSSSSASASSATPPRARSAGVLDAGAASRRARAAARARARPARRAARRARPASSRTARSAAGARASTCATQPANVIGRGASAGVAVPGRSSASGR